jgi:glycosyltransferase involved in cell wall biosynthesis
MGLTYANKIVHVSDYYSDLYPNYKNKSLTIHNGLDLPSWKKTKNSNFIKGKNKTKFCYIGRASAMKGLDTILNSNIPNDVDFYFVVSYQNAEEPFMSKIKNMANDINIFHIPGLYGQEKIDFLFEMDAIVMPSIHEPFGIVALEALASESILITTAAGGIKEIVNNIDYIHINNSNDLSKAFNSVKNLSEDNKKAMIQKGKNHANNFSWNIQAKKLYEVYKEVSQMEYNENKVKCN